MIDSAPVPGSDHELRLYRRGDEFSIRVAGCELMNSRMHGSEDALAHLVCERFADCQAPAVLIGGLGMGYTVAAALRHLPADAGLSVVELVPQVVVWNRQQLGELAGNPLADPRVTVHTADVSRVIMEKRRAWDAIILDVDNGPDGLTSRDNDRLYDLKGLTAAFVALRPGGVLAVWSAAGDPSFTKRLRQAGFSVTVVNPRARGKRGGRHTVWLARRDS
jgi:spermidine synthase